MKKLPDSELQVMQAIWSCDNPALRKDFEPLINKVHPIAQTTLFTLLSRLQDKGFIKIDKNGRNTTYTPLITRQEYLSKQSRRFIDQLCGGSISTFANALCNQNLTKEELQELRKLLKENMHE